MWKCWQFSDAALFRSPKLIKLKQKWEADLVHLIKLPGTTVGLVADIEEVGCKS